jgi:hypothetical protein
VARKGASLPMQRQGIDPDPKPPRPGSTREPSDREIRQPVTEAAIMTLLLSSSHQGPWTRAELELEMSSAPLHVQDTLRALQGSGLVHVQGRAGDRKQSGTADGRAGAVATGRATAREPPRGQPRLMPDPSRPGVVGGGVPALPIIAAQSAAGGCIRHTTQALARRNRRWTWPSR